MAPTPPVSGGASRSNPFGAARYAYIAVYFYLSTEIRLHSPVDVTNREKEVEERLERERGAVQEKLTMSRTSSRTGVERGGAARPQTPPVSGGAPPKPQPTRPVASLAPSVRPTLSFASAAAAKKEAAKAAEEAAAPKTDSAEEIAEGVSKLSV